MNTGHLDFVGHIAARLELGTQDALALLGEWLSNYEPVVRREVRVLAPATALRAPRVIGPSSADASVERRARVA